jgi:hypothetical protein
MVLESNKSHLTYGTKMHNTERIRTNYKIPQNGKLIWVRQDIHTDTENKIPFNTFYINFHI